MFKQLELELLIVELQFRGFVTFTFCSILCLYLCKISSVLDKDPSGLKVLACCQNKFKCERSLYLQSRTKIIIIMNRIQDKELLAFFSPALLLAVFSPQARGTWEALPGDVVASCSL